MSEIPGSIFVQSDDAWFGLSGVFIALHKIHNELIRDVVRKRVQGVMRILLDSHIWVVPIIKKSANHNFLSHSESVITNKQTIVSGAKILKSIHWLI